MCRTAGMEMEIKTTKFKDGLTGMMGARSGIVVKALRYKLAGRGFDSQWCHWNFSVTLPFQSHYGPGLTQPLTEMSTRCISWG